ncbi:MAG: hypothetical protein ACRC14_13460 [Paracoccaceae bacterium]
MFDSQQETRIEDEAGRFPPHMTMIRDVFAFSFAEAAETGQLFAGATDLCSLFDRVIAFLEQSTLPEDEIEILVGLIRDEADVISFSVRSRSGVISL